MKLFSKKHHKEVITNNFLFHKIFVLLLLLMVFFSCAKADFTSTSFQMENPVNVIEGGGTSSSSSFQYYSTTGQLEEGQSSSSSFSQNAGFLYFPVASSPVVSATAGDSKVTLNWTAAIGIFANVTNYDIGVSTSLNGTYTYTSVGNVLTYIKTSLVNNTPYFFKIRSYASGILLNESIAANATPVSSGGGGGGGGGNPSSQTLVVFSGKAYPKSVVTLLKDAQIISTSVAGTDASFSITLTDLNAGNYIFSMYSEDANGIRSTLSTFPVSVTSNTTTNVTGIFLAPTIAVDKSEVKRGDDVVIFGQSVPESDIVISVHSDPEYFSKTVSDKNGAYLYNFDTSFLELGDHATKSKASIGNELVSAYSNSVNFKVGDENVPVSPKQKCPVKGDLNGDCRVNLVDFSIAAYWYKKNLSGPIIQIEKAELNGDSKINLVDFSIMAYYWTG